MRDTTTGLLFEVRANQKVPEGATDVTKNKLYTHLKNHGIDWKEIISRKLLPDQAYIYDNKLIIFECKFQKTDGSADEKPQTCGFKILQFNKIAKALGLECATYTYVFNDWFKKPIYKDMLEYIESVPGCSYLFVGEEEK